MTSKVVLLALCSLPALAQPIVELQGANSEVVLDKGLASEIHITAANYKAAMDHINGKGPTLLKTKAACPSDATPTAIDVGDASWMPCGNNQAFGGVTINGFTNMQEGQVLRIVKVSSGGYLKIVPSQNSADRVPGVAYIVTPDWSTFTLPEGTYGTIEVMCTGVQNGACQVVHVVTDKGIPFACDLGSQNCPAKSCLDIKTQSPTSPSGVYWINPGNLGAFEAYCDQVTDGGGLTLAGVWTSEGGYSMLNYAAGKNTGAVKSGPPVSSISHYSSAVINKLFHEGQRSYVTICGRSSSGFVMSKHTKTSANTGYDAFRGVYQTSYMNANGFTAVVDASTVNANPLPYASPGWGAYTVKGRSCADPPGGAGCYHYLPDDISGGGQWLFRENYDDTPRTAYTSSNIWSQLFIR